MSSGKNSLLQFILNQESTTAYGSSKNYGIDNITYQGANKRAIKSDFNHQAHIQSGVGYRAFILSYENKALNALSMSGMVNTPPESPTPTPTPPTPTPEENPPNDGEKGEIPNNTPTPLPADATQALSQISFLNNVTMKVWIPIINKDMPPPFIKTDPTVGFKVVDIELYETCTVTDEEYLQALPPPGSLVLVDYENRQTKSGLTMVDTICTDPNFARIVLAELAGQEISQETMQMLFSSGMTGLGNFGSFPLGDPIGTAEEVDVLYINGHAFYPFKKGTTVDLVVFYHGVGYGTQKFVLGKVKKLSITSSLFMIPKGNDANWMNVDSAIKALKSAHGVTIKSQRLGAWSGGSKGFMKAYEATSQNMWSVKMLADPSPEITAFGENVDKIPTSVYMEYRPDNWKKFPGLGARLTQMAPKINAAGGQAILKQSSVNNHDAILESILRRFGG